MGGTRDQHERSAGFAARDIAAGFVACLPLSVGVFAFGAVLGVLAGAKGVSLGEPMAMGAGLRCFGRGDCICAPAAAVSSSAAPAAV